MSFKRFYTYPPSGCEYDFVLRNIKQKEVPCKHEIIDIGIYDLLKPPFQHSEEKLGEWEKLDPKGWKVVPDCPDLLGEFGQHVNYSNTEYSWELLERYYDPNNPQHLPVIQSEFQNINSLNEYIVKFKDEYGVPNKIAIGSVCKIKNHKIGNKIVRILKNEFPDTWIHVFGMHFTQFKMTYNLIDSFDSTSWTFPRAKGRGSSKNLGEKRRFFQNYLDRINEITTFSYSQSKEYQKRHNMKKHFTIEEIAQLKRQGYTSEETSTKIGYKNRSGLDKALKTRFGLSWKDVII
jgi:hypothetical protein